MAIQLWWQIIIVNGISVLARQEFQPPNFFQSERLQVLGSIIINMLDRWENLERLD